MDAGADGPPPARIAVVGGGLAGSLAALALARRGAAVIQVSPTLAAAGSGLQAMATAFSYGVLQGRESCRQWQRLEQLHGPLGFRLTALVPHDLPPPWAWMPDGALALGSRALAIAQVDPPQLLAALPAALAAAGVERQAALVRQLRPRSGGGWQLEALAPGGAAVSWAADQVVLAAGAGCRALWPSLPERFGVSWAGVLCLSRNPGAQRWLDLVGRGWIVQAHRWQRPLLEARAATLTDAAWIVDPGLAPAGEGVVVGQISLVRPGGAAGAVPDAAWMEQRLREGLARLDPALAHLQAPFYQVPVSFCSDGQPLVGPLGPVPGLWACTGFSGAFAAMPAAAEHLAARVMAVAA